MTYFGTPISANRTRQQVTLWQEFAHGSIEPIGSWDASGAGLGGWDLNVRHAYDPGGRTLYLGNGEQRTTTLVNKAITSAAKAATRLDAGKLAPDGSLFPIRPGRPRCSRCRIWDCSPSSAMPKGACTRSRTTRSAG